MVRLRTKSQVWRAKEMGMYVPTGYYSAALGRSFSLPQAGYWILPLETPGLIKKWTFSNFALPWSRSTQASVIGCQWDEFLLLLFMVTVLVSNKSNSSSDHLSKNPSPCSQLISGETYSQLPCCMFPRDFQPLVRLSTPKPWFFSNYEVGYIFSQLTILSRYLGGGVEVTISQRVISIRTNLEGIHMTYSRSRYRVSRLLQVYNHPIMFAFNQNLINKPTRAVHSRISWTLLNTYLNTGLLG